MEPRACVRLPHTFTLRRAPLYAPDPSSSRTEKAGGGDVTTQPAALVFIFHFRGGSCQSSASVVVRKPGATNQTLNLLKTCVYLSCSRTSVFLYLIGWIRSGLVLHMCNMCYKGMLRLKVYMNVIHMRPHITYVSM